MSLIVMGAAILVVALIVIAGLVIPSMFRTVVSTNDVHIVQSVKKTTSYGKDQAAGNVYYRWPSWMPFIGVKTIQLPVSVFDVELDGYAAYDKGRVPFVVDVMAFFRITETNMAAQRVHSFEDLRVQLKGILQGAARSILAKSEIETILEGRAEFGEMFTKEVDHNLVAWGVQTVKTIELMDIRDAEGSKAIHNIMAKKQSLIDRESRIEVAENTRAAQEAEIQAKQEVELKKVAAEQLVGQRQAEKAKAVGIATQQAEQQVKVEEKNTAEKELDVVKVRQVRAADIAKEVAIVQANQSKEVLIVDAKANKEQADINAQATVATATAHAKAIEVEGLAKGAAEQAILMAPVNTQITLAKEIGDNQGYQTYLLQIRTIEATQAVGIEQSKALEKAEIKIIANAGNAPQGLASASEVFSSKGGMQVGAMLEAFAQTETGAALLNKLTGTKAAEVVVKK